MKQPITKFSSRYVALAVDDVDTDQIIPARFLTTTEREGLGTALFYDWRYLDDGAPNPRFALNRPETAGAQILVAGRNFGCGSSREHAVWALMGAGFRAVVSRSFADIFRANAIANGLLPVQVEPGVNEMLLRDDAGELVVDLEQQTLTRDGQLLARFPIAPFARHCLLRGIDEMEFLLAAQGAIADYETREASPS